MMSGTLSDQLPLGSIRFQSGREESEARTFISDRIDFHVELLELRDTIAIAATDTGFVFVDPNGAPSIITGAWSVDFFDVGTLGGV